MKLTTLFNLICSSALLSGFLIVFPAHASDGRCTATGGPLTANAPPITVPRDAPIGTILTQGSTPEISLYNCNANANEVSILLSRRSTGSYVTTMDFPEAASVRIYATSIPGVGYIVLGGWGIRNKPLPASISRGSVADIDTWDSLINLGADSFKPLYYSGMAGFGLIKTGPITSGQISNQKIGELILKVGDVNNPPVPIYIGSARVTTTGCTVTTPNVPIPMGDLLTSDFTGVGSRTASKSARWSLDCDPGVNGKVVIGSSAIAGPNGTAKLTGSGQADVATGIGVRLFDENGNAMNLSDTQIDLATPSGPKDFNYSVAYEQTTATVTAGKANSTLTLTISYE